jgi:NADH-quinone oxidoreductase subunit A
LLHTRKCGGAPQEGPIRFLFAEGLVTIVTSIRRHRVVVERTRMPGGSPDAVLFVLGAAVAAVAFILLVFGVSRLLSPRDPTPEKLDPYECGMPPQGSAHASAKVRFSTVALIFVLFDAEAVLLFAVGSHIRGSGAALVSVVAFVAFLGLGLGYAWMKGAFTWRS